MKHFVITEDMLRRLFDGEALDIPEGAQRTMLRCYVLEDLKLARKPRKAAADV